MTFFPLGKGWDGACSGLDGPLVELLPLGEGWDGAYPGNSVGVAFSRRRYTQSDNIVLYISAHQPGAVTPAAKRNTYSVAIMVVLAPRVAVFVRNTGLGNRNTYSVAVACGKLCLSSPV